MKSDNVEGLEYLKEVYNENKGNEPHENIISTFLKKIQESPSRYRMKQTNRLSIIIESVKSVHDAFTITRCLLTITISHIHP